MSSVSGLQIFANYKWALCIHLLPIIILLSHYRTKINLRDHLIQPPHFIFKDTESQPPHFMFKDTEIQKC